MTYGTSHIQDTSHVFKKQFQLTLPQYELHYLHVGHLTGGQKKMNTEMYLID
jgi:hypothetical protein